MNIINEVMTTAEAADLWGLSAITVKQACSGQKGLPPRFKEGEFRKSGRTWLVTRTGMERLYGEPEISVKNPSKTFEKARQKVV